MTAERVKLTKEDVSDYLSNQDFLRLKILFFLEKKAFLG